MKKFKIGKEYKIVGNGVIHTGDYWAEMLEMYHYIKIGTRVKVIRFLACNNIEVETGEGLKQAVLPEHLGSV